jgi:transcriptional repressor NrdR
MHSQRFTDPSETTEADTIMRCPFCKATNNDRVIDSRLTEGGNAIRRRRECLACGRRYTTKERVDEEAKLTVVKRDGTRVPFDRGKIVTGLRRACFKRPVPAEQIAALVGEVEEELMQLGRREVPAKLIGELVVGKLRHVDQIAYVRFASVYRNFQDVGEFIDEAKDVLERSVQHVSGQQDLF